MKISLLTRGALAAIVAAVGLGIEAAPTQATTQTAAQSQAAAETSGSVDRAAIRPGGPLVARKQSSVPARPPVSSMTSAECRALSARVRAGKAKAAGYCVGIDALQSPGSSAEQKALRTRVARAISQRALPAECGMTSDSSGTWWAQGRRNACNHVRYGLSVIIVNTGQVIGTAVFHSINTMSASGTRWNTTNFTWVWSWTGVGFPEYATGGMFGCPGCLASTTSWTHPVFDEWRGTGYYDAPALATGAKINVSGGFWEITFGSSKYGTPPAVTFSLYTAQSRCDNAIGNRTPGCVFGNIAGLIGFSQGSYPDFVWHVYQAQLSGLPGRMSTGTYLKRLSNSTLVAANGSKACPSSIPRPTGMQCDEYPFRSTYQGASTGGGVARSFPWCKMPDPQRTGSTGWSRCFIPSSQNLGAGGVLGGFYSNERILDGDLFQIGYTS